MRASGVGPLVKKPARDPPILKVTLQRYTLSVLISAHRPIKKVKNLKMKKHGIIQFCEGCEGLTF